jgi:CHAT domain-containing protein
VWKITKQLLSPILLFALTLYFVLSASISFGYSQTHQKATSDDAQKWGNIMTSVENKWEDQYESYFERKFFDQSMNARQVSQKLLQLRRETGKNPAVLWLSTQPEALTLLLITPGEPAIGESVAAADLRSLSQLTKTFVEKINQLREDYLEPAQQLYQWLIAPIEPYLEAAEIDTLILCQGGGLRAMPLAALHDGDRFLVEKYSIVSIPGFNLTPMSLNDLEDARVLAMGATQFKEQVDLPAVAVELSAITPNPWQGESILNQGFTVKNLQAQRQKEAFKIIHLATHADFVPGTPRNSYIQFSDEKLTLDRLNRLGWRNPPVELLVLSACQTAVGDRNAEMGFAGLALQSGVKSALASLWYVSDAGTLALMSEFYQQLKSTPLKAEALRKAQIALMKGKVYLQDRELVSSRGAISLPSSLAETENNLSHPFYWASFVLIGSPW